MEIDFESDRVRSKNSGLCRAPDGSLRRLQLPREEGGGAEHVSQAVPGPAALDVGPAPADGKVGALPSLPDSCETG